MPFSQTQAGLCARNSTAVALSLAAVLACGILLSAPAHAATISNGIIGMGIQQYGNLGAPGGAYSRNCGTYWNGNAMRYLPTQDEAEDCDQEGEGWGVSSDNGGFGYAYRTISQGHWVSLVANRTDATATVDVGNLRVIQHYHPHPTNVHTYVDDIALQNRGTTALHHVLYCRGISWGAAGSYGDYAPYGPEDFTIAHAGLLPAGSLPPPALAAAKLQDYATGNMVCPQLLAAKTSGVYGTVVEGPPVADHADYKNDLATNWVFDFGNLPPGKTKTFQLYYGGSPALAKAMQDLQEIDAQAYSTARPMNGGQLPGESYYDGSPVTWFQAFGGNLTKFADRPPIPAFSVREGDCRDSRTFVSASGSRSGNPTTQLVNYTWDFGDGAKAYGSSAAHGYSRAGTFTITLTVRDDADLSASATKMVHSLGYPADCPPVLAPIPNQVVRLGQSVRSLCVHAYDSDDASSALTWSFSWVQGQLPRGMAVDAKPCLSWMPRADQMGTWPIHVRVCDRHACDARDFWILVWDLPPPTVPGPCPDYDHDGVCDPADNCPGIPNYDQADENNNGLGDACQATDSTDAQTGLTRSGWVLKDRDRDGVADSSDNCPATANRGQADLDGDGIGDLCDSDLDGDGVPNSMDNCPIVPNSDQQDADENGRGDACDATARTSRSMTSVHAAVAEPHHPVALPASAVASVLATAAIVLAILWRRWIPLLITLFSRLAGMDVLQHPVRAKIMAMVEATPGIHYHALVKALDLAHGSFEHHANVLVQAGFVWRQDDEGRLQFFPASSRRTEVHSTPIDWAARMMREVQASPGQSVAELARTLGTPGRTVYRQAYRLAADGKLRLERHGQRVLAFPPHTGQSSGGVPKDRRDS